VYVTTPPVNESGVLPIELEIAYNRSQIKTNREFEYRDNPVFTDITPTNHLVVWVSSITITDVIVLQLFCDNSEWIVRETMLFSANLTTWILQHNRSLEV